MIDDEVLLEGLSPSDSAALRYLCGLWRPMSMFESATQGSLSAPRWAIDIYKQLHIYVDGRRPDEFDVMLWRGFARLAGDAELRKQFMALWYALGPVEGAEALGRVCAGSDPFERGE